MCQGESKQACFNAEEDDCDGTTQKCGQQVSTRERMLDHSVFIPNDNDNPYMIFFLDGGCVQEPIQEVEAPVCRCRNS